MNSSVAFGLLLVISSIVSFSTSTNAVSNLGFPIDSETCAASHLLQVERALHDTESLIDLALDTLLTTPRSDVVRRYFGRISTEVDVTVPMGVLNRIKQGKKADEVVIRCDSSPSVACKKSERFATEGGYVAQIAHGVSAITLCPLDFSDTSRSPRKFLEDICQDDWTLSESTPTAFWSAALLSLFLQAPQLSSPSMRPGSRAYSNVIELAQRDPRTAEHNIYTYLYFTLDLFARAHVHGGCAGQTYGRVHEQSW